MSTFLYCIKQGFKNFAQKPLFTIASVATASLSIFLFCAFLAIVTNLTGMIHKAENSVGITVFFAEDAEEAKKTTIRQKIIDHGGVDAVRYISADEAWESFKKEYFGDAEEELSKAFEDDNPLAKSDSLEVFPASVDVQEELVAYIRSLPGVREVNYLSEFVASMKKVNRAVYVVSLVITGVLFAVTVFLISNTISVAAAFRRRENEIMRMIGATDLMIRAPFVVEGTLIGILGTVIPLIAVRLIYHRAETYLAESLQASSGFLKDIVVLIPLSEIFPQMALAGLLMGVGTGMVVSFITISRHLRV